MANISEIDDTQFNYDNPSSGVTLNTGDTFHGHFFHGGDDSDAVILGGMEAGQTYTISVTLNSFQGFNEFSLINHDGFADITFEFFHGVLMNGPVIDSSFGTAEGNPFQPPILSFNFTPTTDAAVSLQLQDTGNFDFYFVNFEQVTPEFPELPELPVTNEITGGTGNDRLNGSAEADLADLGEGADHLNGQGGNDTIDGGAGDDKLQGGDGLDELIGGAGKDNLSGGDGNDNIAGGVGNDVLKGDAGNDTLDGGNNNDRIYGGTGDDVMNGDHGNDKMWGDAGNDSLDGGIGNDVMNGGADDDVLTGGAGRDNMTGGTGADTFVFAAGMGKDVITDFEDGVDTLDFSAYGLTDFSQLTLQTQGANVLITAGAGDSVLLRNVDIVDLDNSDFAWV